MIAGSVRRIKRLNYLLGGVLVIAAALTQSQTDALGVAVGVALSCLNFFLLEKLVTRWTSEAAEGRSTTASSMLMLPKMMALGALVVLSLAFLPISGVGFVIGYSVFVASIFVEIILSAVLPTPQTPSEQNHG